VYLVLGLQKLYECNMQKQTLIKRYQVVKEMLDGRSERHREERERYFIMFAAIKLSLSRP
jgi:hypothetical protein